MIKLKIKYISRMMFFMICCLGLYVSGWIMFCKPIIKIVQIIYEHTYTISCFIWPVVQILFSGLVGGAICFVGLLAMCYLEDKLNEKSKKNK